MDEQSVIHSTFVLERSFQKPVERVFAAFADEGKKRRWFGEGAAHDVEEFAMDFKVGGGERFRYRFKEGSLFPGVVLTNTGSYLEIVPNRRVVTASTMDFGGRRISASLVTIELVSTEKGTDLICTHQGAFLRGRMVRRFVRRAGRRCLKSWKKSLRFEACRV